jgi:uncharacterized membrane protein
VNDKEFFGCALGALLILAPLILLIIGVVQLRKLKAAVAQLIRRVAELESRGVSTAPAPGPPVAETMAPSAAVPPPVPRTVPDVSPPELKQAVFPPPSLEPPPPPRPPPPPQGPPPVPPPPPKPFDWEAFFGVKLFAWIGGFVLFLGIVFLI